MNGSKDVCDEDGQCLGYSDPCGSECFGSVLQGKAARKPQTTRPSGTRAQTTPHERQPLLQNVYGTSNSATMENSQASLRASANDSTTHTHTHNHNHSHNHHHHITQKRSSHSISSTSTSTSTPPPHHHHVPSNVFLSLGLQTSTAIALHKIPEGFITYATNHANPRLGFAVFLALFIHNITEGFALALPLYLAINSRWKAMAWSTLLGGVSQPLGAGVAALWFKIARRGAEDGAGEPGDLVYGVLFAVTSGIMAMVSLQLLGESLDLTHSKRVCFISAFCGMGILGFSSALTA